MQRVRRATAVAVLPADPAGGPPGYFPLPNPGGGVPAAVPGYEWYNNVQEEICSVIAAAGMTLDGSNRSQLSAAIQQLIATGGYVKLPVRAATTANIATLSGGAPNTLDGVSLAANDRILVKDQSIGSQNGIYVVTTLGTGANGTWTRATDADAVGELIAGSLVTVAEGTLSADSLWELTTDGTITIGTTALTFFRKDKDAPSATAAGEICFFATKTAPSGFLKANGAAVSRASYAALFAALCPSSAVTISIASPGVVTWNSHPFVAGERLRLTTTGALPTGLTAATQDYYVSPAALGTNSFTVGTKARTPFICSMTIASPGVVTTLDNTGAGVAHGLSAGEVVVFDTTGALPTGVTAGTPYYVIATGLTTSAFQFSATLGGAAVNTSGSQSGTHTVAAHGVQINTSGSQSGTHTATAYWHGAGDGSTTFTLPDLRGEFLRGFDDARGIDNRRPFGAWQTDEIITHKHSVQMNASPTLAAGSAGQQYQAGSTTTVAAITATGGVETRPRNIAGLACIRY